MLNITWRMVVFGGACGLLLGMLYGLFYPLLETATYGQTGSNDVAGAVLMGVFFGLLTGGMIGLGHYHWPG